MNMDPEVGRVCQVAFDGYAIVKLLGPVVVNRIDRELPKVMAYTFQGIGGVQVIRAEGLGNRGGLFVLHVRRGILSGGYENGLGFPERCGILPGRENA
jgi:hypothetical protein